MGFYEKILKKGSNKNPKVLIMVGSPKSGKTTVISRLKGKLLHISIGDNGTDYLEGFHSVSTTFGGENGTMKYLDLKIEALNECKATKSKFDYIAIDVASDMLVGIDSIINQLTIISHNKTVNASKRKKADYDMKDYGEGYGWTKLQDEFTKEMKFWGKLTKHLIIVTHIKRRVLNESTDTLDTVDAIDLPGKLATLVAGAASAVGFAYRRGNNLILSFKKPYEGSEMGSRCEHLDGKDIIISTKEDGKLTTFWNKIYLD